VSFIIPTLVCDVQGLELTADDKVLLKHPATAGIILFARNYDNPKQLLALTHSILKENPSLFISVDQEGGRVQRFRDGFSTLPSMRYWGEQYAIAPTLAKHNVKQTAAKMAHELKNFHIAFSYAPVLDLDYAHNDVIGERSFNRNPDIVTELGRAFIKGLCQEHMCSVGKHFPGHGFVRADSHFRLPIDNREKKEIWDKDLSPFYNLIDCLDAIMPAHIVYSTVDSLPTCFSSIWLQQILRGQLKFKGVIFTDDLNMAAVNSLYSIEDCVYQSLNAGCDFLLMCNNQSSAAKMLQCLEKPSAFKEERKARVNQFIKKTRTCIV
jgi:beta-N-acetylhexosaminidase